MRRHVTAPHYACVYCVHYRLYSQHSITGTNTAEKGPEVLSYITFINLASSTARFPLFRVDLNRPLTLELLNVSSVCICVLLRQCCLKEWWEMFL